MTDLELLERARGGDAHSFGQLVERYRTAAFRAAAAALGSLDEADDVVQDACIAAFHKLASFRGDSSFRTWLVAITWRAALTRRRRVRRSLRAFPTDHASGPHLAGSRGPGAADPDPMATGGTAEDALLGAELAATIVRLVRALPRRLRDPLLLAGSGEFSYEEVAAIVGAPVGTVKWRVSDARRRIKERLLRMGYVDGR